MGLREELGRALEGRKEAILSFGQDLVRIASENPPGAHYRECADRIRVEMERLGFAPRVIEAPGLPEYPRFNLLAFHGEGPRTLYFHGHYDVVPAQSRDQFTPRIEHGRLIGRGSADMKLGVVGMIYATALLRELRVPLAGRIGLCVVADEETGGQGGSGYLDRLGVLGQDAIGMLTPEPTSGVIWNANRGAVTLRITVKGKTAHVGLQHEGVNAFERMLTVATALQGLKAEVERRRTSYRIHPEEAAHSILMLGGRVEGGANFNVVPGACSFTVERRFNPEEDLETEKARLLAVLDGCRAQGIGLDVEILQEGVSSGVPEDHPLGVALADTVEAVTGKRPAFTMCPGILEIRWYARKGIPAYAYGPGLLEISHGPHESIRIDRIWEDTLVYALTAARVLA